MLGMMGVDAVTSRTPVPLLRGKLTGGRAVIGCPRCSCAATRLISARAMLMATGGMLHRCRLELSLRDNPTGAADHRRALAAGGLSGYHLANPPGFGGAQVGAGDR